jgi:hypothetical protein
MPKSPFLLLIVLVCTACEFSSDLNLKKLKGYEFNLHDIQEYCTVKREGDQHLAIYCKNKKLKPVISSCEGQMSHGLVDPKFYCSGGLWVLNNSCYIAMLDTHNGNIMCKKQ